MSLIKQTATPAGTAARQANGRLAHGPVTPEGQERSRSSNVRHGFYSQEPLIALGEDPQDFERLLESLHATWQPADTFQTRLVHHLARAVLRMERGDRMLESAAVEQLQRLDRNVDREARESAARSDRKLFALNALMDAAGHANFATGFPELLAFDSVYGDNTKGKPGQIMALLYRLLKPRPAEQTTDAAGSPLPVPAEGVPIAEGSERYGVREELLALLRDEVRETKEAQTRKEEELLETTTPYVRDTMMVPRHPQAALMLRMEESGFRQVERLTNLLIKLKSATAQLSPTSA